MGQIKLLDQNMINMIAAGEVIERPASVVKELMENSIDAGATRLTVAIEDGGRKLIAVTDNGCGMDGEDLAAAFEAHATSKIKSGSDLHHISTLGFRGEALASIGAVAQVKATSRTKDGAGGNCIEIDCGDKGAVAPCSTDYGTTIQIRDIFYKLPARQKFLKTANTEMGHISECFTRIALANCGIDMTLISNGREIYRLPGKQSIRDRVAALFSAEIAENLLETEREEKGLHLFALLGRPAISRTNNQFQYAFLNGRFIHDKFITHAIKEAYRGNIEQNRSPVVFLFMKLPFEDYDVNVHPTKIEVRFFNTNLIYSQILGCLREKLLGTNLDVEGKVPIATIPAGGQRAFEPSAEPAGRQNISDAMAEFFKQHRDTSAQRQFGFRQRPADIPIEAIEREETYSRHNTLNAIQIHDSFIVAETGDGFIVVDQHAIHERIMYEDLRRRINAGKLESQKLLIPESFEVSDGQAEIIKENTELLERLGIEVVPFGPKTYAIQAFATLLAKAAPADFVRDLIDLLAEKGAAVDEERLLDEVLHMAACKAAIKAGQKLCGSEIEKLLADREDVESASRCPHGRPTSIRFSTAELEKQFKRT